MTESNPAYRCAALVMVPKKRQLTLMLASEGAETWAFEELEKSKSEGPSWENCEIIKFLAQQGQEDVMASISKIAIEWNDAVVWCSIVERSPKWFLGQEGYTSLCDGWELFKLDAVRPT
jgi:hypothetical protein